MMNDVSSCTSERHQPPPTMKTDKPVKKGFFALLRDSFTKTGGCCGSGESCCGTSKETTKAKPVPEPSKPAQK